MLYRFLYEPFHFHSAVLLSSNQWKSRSSNKASMTLELLNTRPHQPEWLTALNPFLGRDQAATTQAFIFRYTHTETHTHTPHSHRQLYAFVQDVKGFLDKCSASGTVLINLPDTQTYIHRYTLAQRLSVCAQRSFILQSLSTPPSPFLYLLYQYRKTEAEQHIRVEEFTESSPNF